MAKKYIQALVDWPGFTWDAKVLAPLLSDVRSRRIADFWCYPSVRLDGFVYIAGLEWKEGSVLEEGMDPRVDAYIEKAASFAQPVLTHLRELVHQACPRVTEAVKWGMPFFMQQGIVLCHMAAFKQHCAFGFWGPEMKKVLAEDGLVASQAMGSLGRITGPKDLPPDRMLLGYLRRSAEFVESGARTKSIDRRPKAATRSVRVPAELSAALKKNKMAAKAFEGFSPSCRREYAEWIAGAKRSETRAKRIAQAVKWIAEGKSRNWKYEMA
jgi:uncharacterized protein YdeI (YjbR/CyaY-like superfamily)